MKIQEDNKDIKSHGPLLSLTWLVAGVGIGALAGILLAPQSGEDTREWISSRQPRGLKTGSTRARTRSPRP
jgi:gas vesicle protein